MASEFQRTCPQDRQTGSSIGYCIYDTLFLSLCQGFGGIFGEFNMFAKILPYFLQQLSEQHAAVFPTDGQNRNRRQYRTKSVWRLCTPSALRASPHPVGNHLRRNLVKQSNLGISPPRGESPLSGEAIMKIDFRESALFPVEIAKNFSTFCFSLRIL